MLCSFRRIYIDAPTGMHTKMNQCYYLGESHWNWHHLIIMTIAIVHGMNMCFDDIHTGKVPMTIGSGAPELLIIKTCLIIFCAINNDLSLSWELIQATVSVLLTTLERSLSWEMRWSSFHFVTFWHNLTLRMKQKSSIAQGNDKQNASYWIEILSFRRQYE